jgi:putative transposase
MLLSYSYRLYPNPTQRENRERILAIHRGLYNGALSERRLGWEKQHKSISYADQANQLKAIRQFDEDAAWVNFSSVQQTLRRLDKAFQAFFRRIRAGEKPGYPRYKGRQWFNAVCYVYNDGLRLAGQRLSIQRVGKVRLFQHRPLPDDAKIKMVVIKRDGCGNWYAVFQVELPDIEPMTTPLAAAGIDMGLMSFIALSNGEEVDNPRWFREGEERLAKLQRIRSRCKRGSNHYAELTRLIRQHHERMGNRRKDFHHKLSRALVNRFPLLFVEDLNIRGLSRSHVAKSMADAGWSQFLFFLDYKAANAGGQKIEVDARGTSQYCPECGCSVEKSLSIRIHRCQSCGYVAPRDVAAAQVILKRGLARTVPGRKVFQTDVQSVWSPEASPL